MKLLINKLIYNIRSFYFKKIIKTCTVDINWGDGTKNIYIYKKNEKTN